MRKQNDSIPAALKPDNRLIDAVIRSRKCKRPNAQKHGLFARPLIIPGEDPREFDQILAALWRSGNPPAQRFAMLSPTLPRRSFVSVG